MLFRSNENDIVRVHIGDTATIEVDAYLGKKFKGIVTEVANSANVKGITVDQVTNFTVKVRILRDSYKDITDPDHPEASIFHPGMSATVDIRTKRVADVFAVPIQAVTTRDTTDKASFKNKNNDNDMGDEDEIRVTNDKDKPVEQEKKDIECVFILEGDHVKFVPVVSGIQDNMYIQIKSGLKEGQEIVSAPYNLIARELKDGDKIEKVKKEDLYSSGKK